MNRLREERSLYLLQHAQQPVSWWPWCDEAFAEAKRRDLPVLLSIGYSTCHWCHVMSHESFEDPKIAAFMNEHFVCIKVDREERPDIDAVYMQATQALTGQGGWPMTVFLTTDRKPFYAGTYFPPRELQGMPSFLRVLASMSDAWNNRKEHVLNNADALNDFIQESLHTETAEKIAISDAVEKLHSSFDEQYGGWGDAPKFPSPATLDFLLTQPDGQEMALKTLSSMTAGGIFDQLGGGFHRYSVDRFWLVPHFEKMLYDNAQLVRTLLSAFQITGQQEYAQAADHTLGYLMRVMQSSEGAFFAAQDADTATDSGNVEGLTYTWSLSEVEEVLSEDAQAAFIGYGMTAEGHFRDPHQVAWGTRCVLSKQAFVDESIRERLFRHREKRTQPQIDRSIITAWNGLMLAALADAERIRDDFYLLQAKRNAAFFKKHMRRSDGSLFHIYRQETAAVEGLLQDHALYGLGLIALYRACGEQEYLDWALELRNLIRRDFWCEEKGVFYSTGGRTETLISRQASYLDGPLLSDNAAAALLELWIQRLLPSQDTGQRPERVLAYFNEAMNEAQGVGGLWQVAAFLQSPLIEIKLCGDLVQRQALQEALVRHFLPFAAIHQNETGNGALICLQGRCLPMMNADELSSATLE